MSINGNTKLCVSTRKHMYRTMKPVICLYYFNLHTVPITIPVNDSPWVSQIKQGLFCPLIGAMTHGVSINLWRWEEDFSTPPPSTTTTMIQCRGQTNKKLMPGIHESFRLRDTRQFIMSTRSCAYTKVEAVEADARPLTTSSQQKQSPSKRPLL